jgi:hypothetical protein
MRSINKKHSLSTKKNKQKQTSNKEREKNGKKTN